MCWLNQRLFNTSESPQYSSHILFYPFQSLCQSSEYDDPQFWKWRSWWSEHVSDLLKVKKSSMQWSWELYHDYTVYGILQASILEWGSHSLLQGIFPTQGLNPGLTQCGRILYQLSYQGGPRILEWVAYPFSSISFWPRDRTGVSWIAGRFFTSWATREALHQDYLISSPCFQNKQCSPEARRSSRIRQWPQWLRNYKELWS